MIEFINSFLTYFVLLVIMASISVLGIYYGMVLRKKKTAKDELKAMKNAENAEQSEEQ